MTSRPSYICFIFSASVDESGDVLTLELEKNAGVVGFGLEGGKGSIHGDKPLAVNRIYTGTTI